jgi:hypothetical protein
VNVLSFALQFCLGIVLPFWVVRRDQRRLRPAELDRTWNEPSFWAAIVTFGPLCIPVHFAKSRRSWLGLLAGIAWMFAVFGAIGGAEWVFEGITGIP